MTPARRYLRNRRLLITALVVAILIILIVGGLTVFGRGVDRRRMSSQERAQAIEQKVAEQHAADLRLCQVAMNVNAERFLAIITKLGKLAPPPATEEETERIRQFQAIINEDLAPIDCEAFVATGAIVPASSS